MLLLSLSTALLAHAADAESLAAAAAVTQWEGASITKDCLDGKVFNSDRLMVKHSNEYKPPEHSDDAKESYKTLIADDAGGAPK